MKCLCAEDGATRWVEHLFGDCLYTTPDRVSFALGLASVGLWMVAQVPQLLRNARTGSGEALSPFFLVRCLVSAFVHQRADPTTPAQAEWLLGDTCNLLGCLLTGALATQTVTAGYYLAMDAVLISQVAYLAGRARHRRRASVLHRENVEDGVSEPSEAQPAAGGDGLDAPLLAHSSSSGGSGMASRPRAGTTTAVAALTAAPLMWLLSSSMASPPPGAHGLGSHARTQGGPGVVPPCGGGSHSHEHIGMLLGWLSAACYLASRVSQLRKNAARGEAGGSGLAFTMFATAVLANGLYGTSVLLRLIASGGRPGDWAHAAPWLAGSLGVMLLDIVLSTQALRAASRGGGDAAAAGEDRAAATEGYVPPAAGR